MLSSRAWETADSEMPGAAEALRTAATPDSVDGSGSSKGNMCVAVAEGASNGVGAGAAGRAGGAGEASAAAGGVAAGTGMDDLAAGAAATRSVAAPRFKVAPTMEARLQFKLRIEVQMFEIKDRNHKGRQGAYPADDSARVSFLKRTAKLVRTAKMSAGVKIHWLTPARRGGRSQRARAWRTAWRRACLPRRPRVRL
jgi:hypothetical protein